MEHKISNELDFLVGRAELETNHARTILKETQEANDYWKEKAAAKLVAFCEAHEQFIRLYVECKLYHKDLADILENKWPYLKELQKEGTTEFKDFNQNS